MSIKQRIGRRIEKCRRIKHKGGHGIHSPFAYRLITEVIEERHAYYRLNEFRQILNHTKRHKPNDHHTIRSQRYYALLFRLLNRFAIEQIVQIGTHFGLIQLLFQMVENDVPYYWIEHNPQRIAPAKELVDHATESIEPLAISLSAIQHTTLRSIDFTQSQFLFLHSSGLDSIELSELNKALFETPPDSVWVIDDITFHPEMKHLWSALKTHPKVIASFDLIDVGILVFNPKIHPQDYKLFF